MYLLRELCTERLSLNEVTMMLSSSVAQNEHKVTAMISRSAAQNENEIAMMLSLIFHELTQVRPRLNLTWARIG